MRIAVMIFALALVACSATGVVPMDSGTYMIVKKSPQVGFGPPVGIKADVYREANEFCGKESKTVDTIELQTTDAGLARSAVVSLTFRCL